MSKWAITYSNPKKRWQFVSFRGAKGGESAGIVDVVAIRKDFSRWERGMKPGDLFDIVLLQMKGGKARDPTPEEVRRMLAVGRYYHCKSVVLARWRKGESPTFYSLNDLRRKKVDLSEIFG